MWRASGMIGESRMVSVFVGMTDGTLIGDKVAISA
jgi:hypothetical protein